MKAAAAVLLIGMGWMVWRSRAVDVRPNAINDTAQKIGEALGFMNVAHNSKPTRTSSRGIKLIKEHEGFSATVYRDAAGHPTIGYGHLIKPGEKFPARISEENAEAILRADVYFAERAVIESVRVPLSQVQFDALVSFVFNVGAGSFRTSTLLRKLNAGDYEGAAAEFTRWTRAGGRVLPGLVSRRAQESNLFLAGIGGAGGVAV